MNHQHPTHHPILKSPILPTNHGAPGAFYPACQIPYAYQIHLLIKNYIPRNFARFIATVWFVSTGAVCCGACAVCNVLFSILFWPFRLIMPNELFFFCLEFITAIIFSIFGYGLLLLNCFTWPIFEHREYRRDCQPSDPQTATTPATTETSPHVQGSPYSSSSFDDDVDVASDSSTDQQHSDASTTASSPASSPDNGSELLVSGLRRRDRGFLKHAKHLEPSRHVNRLLEKIHSSVSSTTTITDQQGFSIPQFSSSSLSATEFVPRQTIMMCNHLSNADGFVLRGLTMGWPGVKIVYKADLQKVPFLGQAMMAGREVPVYFNESKGGWGVTKSVVVGMMERVANLIQLNIPVLVFPEGTRRRFNRMSPFRKGFFQFCVETGTEAYPTVLYGPQYSWPTGSFMVDFHEIYVVYGKQSIPSTGHTVDSLVSAVRTSMVELLKLCPGYDNDVERPIETLEEFTRLEREAKEKLKFF